jgi:mannosyltransferase
LLRIHSLDANSLWNDELMSVAYANSDGFWERLLRSATTINMAFYYVVLHFWLNLGQSDFFVRLPSVVFGLLAIPAIYVLGARLFDRKVGIIAALLLAVHALHIEYSQEARSYSLAVLLAILSSLFLVRVIERSTPNNWLSYIVFSVLMVYTHVFGLLVIMAHAVSFLFILRQQVPWMDMVISMITIGLMLLPLGVLTLVHGDAVNWVPTPSLEGIHQIGINFTGNNGNILLVTFLVPVLVALALAAKSWFSRGDAFVKWKYGFLFTWLLAPMLIALGYSLLVKPVFVDRFLLVAFPALVLLAAVGVACIADVSLAHIRLRSWGRVPALAAILLVVLITLSTQGTAAYYDRIEGGGDEDWRGVNSYVLPQWQPGDAMLFYVPWSERNFEWYNWRWDPDKHDQLTLAITRKEWERLFDGDENPDSEILVQRISNDQKRVWLVLSHANGSRKPVGENIESALEQIYQEREDRKFNGIRVAVFSKPRSLPSEEELTDSVIDEGEDLATKQ